MSDFRVLHDWDKPYRSGRWCLRRGLKLILYALSRRFRPLMRLRVVKEIYNELYLYSLTLAKLDRLMEVQAVFGLNTTMIPSFPKAKEELEMLGADVRLHWHIDDLDPVVRLWDPPLHQTKETWHYDMDTKAGKMPLLKFNELPIWHVDYPNLISDYIEWLYKVKFEDMKIYD